MKKDLRKFVKSCVNSTLYCALATAEKNGVWVCPVAFATDSLFNIYFVSSPKSRHMKNIRKNARVAIAIYTTGQKASGTKIGVQLEGTTRLLKENADISFAYKTYFNRFPKWEGATLSYFKQKNCGWPFVKVAPKALYYFNNGLFGEERKRVK